jgi:hypothetical protein
MPRRTYESAYQPPEEPPPPNDPRGYRGPDRTTHGVAPALLVTGSRAWDLETTPRMTRYVDGVVRRAREQSLRLLTGDSALGVEAAVVAACQRIGVPCDVYGVGPQPRNPRVRSGARTRYVQTLREEVAPGQPVRATRAQLRALSAAERDARLVAAADRVLVVWNGDPSAAPTVYARAAAGDAPADLVAPRAGRLRVVRRNYDPEAPAPPPTDAAPTGASAPVIDTDEVAAAPGSRDDLTAFTAGAAARLQAQLLQHSSQVAGVAPDVLATAAARALAFQPLPLEALYGVGLAPADADDPGLAAPPFYDPDRDTALWIGVVQDPEGPQAPATTCVLAVQDAGRSLPRAYLTPVFSGERDAADTAGRQLLEALHARPDLDHFLGVAEGMARAHDRYDDWGGPRGLALADSLAAALAAQHDPRPDDLDWSR